MPDRAGPNNPVIRRLYDRVDSEQARFEANPTAWRPPSPEWSVGPDGQVRFVHKDPITGAQKLFVAGALGAAGFGAGSAIAGGIGSAGAAGGSLAGSGGAAGAAGTAGTAGTAAPGWFGAAGPSVAGTTGAAGTAGTAGAAGTAGGGGFLSSIPTASKIGFGINALTSIFGARQQANAAKDAARIQAESADRAMAMMNRVYQPYLAAGGQSMTALGRLMAPGVPYTPQQQALDVAQCYPPAPMTDQNMAMPRPTPLGRVMTRPRY